MENLESFRYAAVILFSLAAFSTFAIGGIFMSQHSKHHKQNSCSTLQQYKAVNVEKFKVVHFQKMAA